MANANGWTTVSDTSWPGYEQIPGLVMQGYTALLSESLRQFEQPPTHVFIQSGVGGIAAAVAGHFSVLWGQDRPYFVVVDPSRAACLYETARAGEIVKVAQGEPTVMAMLDCYEPSMIAWRILSRAADAFMTVEDNEAVAVMRRLANPVGGDAAVISGESGGVGLAGLLQVCSDPHLRQQAGLGPTSRVFLVNTEGATDPLLYQSYVGATPDEVLARSVETASK